MVINPRFEGAFSFREGLAPTKLDGKWGYINKAGTFVIEPRFDGAYPFSEGLAMVKVGRAVGYIDKTGRYIRVL
jgi:hypothetical protein